MRTKLLSKIRHIKMLNNAQIIRAQKTERTCINEKQQPNILVILSLSWRAEMTIQGVNIQRKKHTYIKPTEIFLVRKKG